MSQVRAAAISNLAGTGPANLTGQSASKAWTHYDQTGTPSILSSFNVSSVTDLGAGTSEHNFTNAFASADSGTAVGSQEASGYTQVYQYLAGSNRRLTRVASTATDDVDCTLSRWGDLA